MQEVKIQRESLKREKQLVTYTGIPIRLSADFSTKTLQAKRDWQEIFKVMKSKDLQPRLPYPAKLSFRIEEQIKSFPDKKKLKEFITTKLVLYEILKGLLKEENKDKNMNNKMAINTYLPTIESKSQMNKQKRN